MDTLLEHETNTEMAEDVAYAIDFITTLAEGVASDWRNLRVSPNYVQENLRNLNLITNTVYWIWQDELAEELEHNESPYGETPINDSMEALYSAIRKLHNNRAMDLTGEDVDAMWWAVWQVVNTYGDELSDGGLDITNLAERDTIYEAVKIVQTLYASGQKVGGAK